MDKQLIKTSKVKELNYKLTDDYNLFRMPKLTNSKLEDIVNNENISAYLKLSGNDEIGEYAFLSTKDFDFKKILKNGVKELKEDNLKLYQKYNLLLRSICKIKKSEYFINSNNNCSIIIEQNSFMISAIEILVTTDCYLKLNLNTYEKKENVIKSYSKNKRQLNIINKRKKFKINEKNNKLERSDKGIWIQKRSNNANKNKVSLIDSKESSDFSKMNELFNLNNFLQENKISPIDMEEQSFKIYKKSVYWNKQKEDYKEKIISFIKENTFEIINNSNDKKATELLIDEFKKTSIKIKNKEQNLEIKTGSSDLKIIIVSNKKELKKLKEEDYYEKIKKDHPFSQIIDQSNIKEGMESIILNSIKELMIKNNIRNKRLDFFSNDKDFIYYSIDKKSEENEDDVEFITVMNVVDNKIKFNKISELELVDHIEERVDFLENDDLSFFYNKQMKGILITNRKCYIIEETEKAVYPDFSEFFSYKERLKDLKNKKIENKVIDNLLNTLYLRLSEITTKINKKETKKLKKDQEKTTSIINNINEIESAFKSSDYSFNDIENFLKTQKSKDKNLTLNELKKHLNIDPSFRKETDLEKHFFKNFISIWFKKDEYYTGDSGAANTKYEKLNYVYKVLETDIDEDFIYFIDNMYVKHLGLGNLPFPDKYINEYNKLN